MGLASIIIVTRNRQEIVLECLKSVLKMDYPNFEVILVDNGSTDKTAQKAKKGFPGVILVEAGKNLGVNAGKNLGQRYAKGGYILFLDSDTIVDRHLLSELIKIARSDPRIGIVCPKIYYFDQKDIIWYAGASINLWTSRAGNLGGNQKDRGQHDQFRETFYAPTAYLATSGVIKKLGGHEEMFFMSYGESDFGFRAKKAGFKVMFCPTAKLWHRLDQKENIKSIRALGYNLPLRAYYFARNRVIFMKRHAPQFNFWVFMLSFFPLMTAYVAYKIIVFKGGWKFLRPHLEGSIDGLKYAFFKKAQNRWV